MAKKQKPNPPAKKSSLSLKGILIAIGGIIAWSATLLANSDAIVENLSKKCVALAICSPSDRFVDARIRVLSPANPTTAEVLGTDGENPAELFAEFSGTSVKQQDFVGIEFSPTEGSTNEVLIDGYPFQAPSELGYLAPEDGPSGWRIGYPILDFLVGANVATNVTDIEIDVRKGSLNSKPYVQIVTPSTDFAKLSLINESIHSSVTASLEFSIASSDWKKKLDDKGEEKERSYPEVCKKLVRIGALKFADFDFKIESVKVSEIETVNLSDFLGKKIPTFSFNVLRNEILTNEKLSASTLKEALKAGFDPNKVPDGYSKWEEDNPYPNDDKWTATALVFGKLIASAAGDTYTSLFCAFVPLEPPEGLGGGGLEFKKAKSVKLEVKQRPYTLNFDNIVRLDPGRPYFRSAIFFTADQSATFDIVLRLKSFEKVIYQSDLYRLNLFVPRLTASKLALDVGGKEIILRAK